MSASASTTIGSESGLRAAFLPAQGFAAELNEELRRDGWTHQTQHGPLVVAARNARRAHAGELDNADASIAWAQNTWRDLREVEFDSIAHAARQLLALRAQWAFCAEACAEGLHRRAQLIQSRLPARRAREWLPTHALPTAPLGAWTLLSPTRMLVSPTTGNPFPNGEIHFDETQGEASPSRAYLKIWELFFAHGMLPAPGDACVDLGSAPGGWTWALQRVGAKVLSVDGAALDPSVAALPGVTYLRGDAFKLGSADLGSPAWIFCDVIAEPTRTLELIQRWRADRPDAGLAFTVKFRGPTDFAVIDALKRTPGARLVHLFHNKHELSCYFRPVRRDE